MLTRRRFLQVGAALAMSRAALLIPRGSAGGTGFTRTSGRIPGSFAADDLLPGNAKMRGLNLVPAAGAWAQGVPGVDGWSVLWEFWDTTWLGSLLDDAVAFGCNVVRTMGSINGIRLGNYNRATYLARWDELNAMCVARGLRLYPCMNPGGYEVVDISYAFLEAEAIAWADRVDSWRNCIGIDVIQEDVAFGSSANGQSLLTAIRGVTDLPLTYSVIGGNPSTLGHAENTSAISSLAGLVDFYDFHWYYNPAVTAIEQYWWDAGHILPIVIGEYGMATVGGSAAQQARYEAVAATINHAGNSGRRPAGALNWCARDFGTNTTTETWGLSDAAGTRRTYIVTPFQTLPVT